MTRADMVRILKPYGVDASPQLCSAVHAYMDLLIKWNKKVSLTSMTRPEEIVGRHFGESFFALHGMPLRLHRLVDVGSGAGFPGLALKLLLPEVDVTLVESNTKKAAFLAEVILRLRLDRVKVLCTRTEEMELPEPIADCVTARAIGRFAELLKWSARALEPGGKIVLWLGAEDAARVAQSPDWSWSEPIAIPNSTRRVLLAGSPWRRPI